MMAVVVVVVAVVAVVVWVEGSLVGEVRVVAALLGGDWGV
jgi:hypothetical protein